jgi:hypothetical protein
MAVIFMHIFRKDVNITMARGGISFERIGAKYATFQAGPSVSAVALVSGVAYVLASACAVTNSGDGQMDFGSAGDPLRGIIDQYEADHYMTVQFAGFREDIPGVSGSMPSAKEFLCVDGAGHVSECATQTAAGRGPAYAVVVDDDADVNTVTVFLG